MYFRMPNLGVRTLPVRDLVPIYFTFNEKFHVIVGLQNVIDVFGEIGSVYFRVSKTRSLDEKGT